MAVLLVAFGLDVVLGACASKLWLLMNNLSWIDPTTLMVQSK